MKLKTLATIVCASIGLFLVGYFIGHRNVPNLEEQLDKEESRYSSLKEKMMALKAKMEEGDRTAKEKEQLMADLEEEKKQLDRNHQTCRTTLSRTLEEKDTCVNEKKETLEALARTQSDVAALEAEAANVTALLNYTRGELETCEADSSEASKCSGKLSEAMQQVQDLSHVVDQCMVMNASLVKCLWQLEQASPSKAAASSTGPAAKGKTTTSTGTSTSSGAKTSSKPLTSSTSSGHKASGTSISTSGGVKPSTSGKGTTSGKPPLTTGMQVVEETPISNDTLTTNETLDNSTSLLDYPGLNHTKGSTTSYKMAIIDDNGEAEAQTNATLTGEATTDNSTTLFANSTLTGGEGEGEGEGEAEEFKEEQKTPLQGQNKEDEAEARALGPAKGQQNAQREQKSSKSVLAEKSVRP